MRLLLDAHYSRLIAELLRLRGHDVASAAADESLRSISDRELFTFAAQDGRTLVTENWADFTALLHEWTAAGRHHSGVLFTSRRRLPRSRATIGLFVETLDRYLSTHPDADALADLYEWLPTTTEPAGS